MTTESEHMPVKHEKHKKWTLGRLMNWAKVLVMKFCSELNKACAIAKQQLIRTKTHQRHSVEQSISTGTRHKIATYLASSS